MTRRFPVLALTVACTSLAFLGCDDDDDVTESIENVEFEGRDERPRVESLPGVELGGLDAMDRRVWSREVSDLLSPCGEPISVAECVQRGAGCDRCLPAARYIARLVAEGLDRGEIRELYRNRYSDDALKEIDIEGAPVRGTPMGAEVTIVEFSDFECPFCREAHPALARVVRQFEGRVRLVFKNYPLPMHEHATAAAIAAVAAHKQGKFWEMHDLLFENQDALERSDLEDYADELGLDLERFRADLDDEETAAAVQRDRDLGREVGVRGTPSIFINGRPFDEPLENLPVYLREELDS